MKDKRALTTLDSLLNQARAKISDIVAADSTFVKRLHALGLVSGAEVTVLHTAPFGGPLSIRVLGSTVSLRRSEASQIRVAPLS